jgi:hypothetical protein
MNNVQIYAFSILHALGALLLPFLIFLLGGCVEPELVNKPGPEIPCEEIDKALNASAPGPWTFQVGEFSYQQETAAPVNQPPALTSEISMLVLSVTPIAGYPGYSSLQIATTVDSRDENGQPKRDTDEGPIDAPFGFQVCRAPKTPIVKETYHNFVVTTGTMPAPMVPLSECDPKFPGCMINITTLRFDQLVTINTGEVLPGHVQIITSNEAPYLSRVLQNCFTFPVEADGRRIPVTRCTTVKNFRFKSS